jgi:hypothetical protein
MIFAGETKVLGENLSSATFSTINPTWIDPGTNPGLRSERPVANRLSHGTALLWDCFTLFLIAVYSLGEVDRYFRGAYCLHHQVEEDEGSTHL